VENQVTTYEDKIGPQFSKQSSKKALEDLVKQYLGVKYLGFTRGMSLVPSLDKGYQKGV